MKGPQVRWIENRARPHRARGVQHTRPTPVYKRACAFVGPSLGRYSTSRGIDLLPPASRGALTSAITAGYRRIGFIDGAIESPSRLPLSELRQALARPEIELLGGASMGAVRAVQLESAGMRGVGHVFRLLRRGSVLEIEDLYVLHAPAALHYRCLTLPLVNIRYTLRSMRRSGQLAFSEEQAILKYVCDVPWFDRDRRSLAAAVYAVCGSRCARVMKAFDSLYRDVKREDALLLVSILEGMSVRNSFSGVKPYASIGADEK